MMLGAAGNLPCGQDWPEISSSFRARDEKLIGDGVC